LQEFKKKIGILDPIYLIYSTPYPTIRPPSYENDTFFFIRTRIASEIPEKINISFQVVGVRVIPNVRVIVRQHTILISTIRNI